MILQATDVSRSLPVEFRSRLMLALGSWDQITQIVENFMSMSSTRVHSVTSNELHPLVFA